MTVTPPLHHRYRWPSKQAKMLSATRVAYATCALIYAIEAVGGYSAFGIYAHQV